MHQVARGRLLRSSQKRIQKAKINSYGLGILWRLGASETYIWPRDLGQIHHQVLAKVDYA